MGGKKLIDLREEQTKTKYQCTTDGQKHIYLFCQFSTDCDTQFSITAWQAHNTFGAKVFVVYAQGILKKTQTPVYLHL